MSYSHIRFEVDGGGIALITIDRPAKLNALSGEVIGELDDAFARVAAEESIRAAILTGAGEKAFVAGADIAELAAMTAYEARRMALRGQAVLRRLETCGKVTVAAVNGFALGGGMELAMACTVRFASEDARLGQPEVKLGIIPGYGGTQRLPRLVGRGRAMEMLLMGEAIGAMEAQRIGLVNAVVPRTELIGFCRAWLEKVLANAPLALALAMEAVDAGMNGGIEEGLRFEASAFGVSAATEDRVEGTRAFLEKRKPAFRGR
ncbi:MAG: enoyl-CoA hydratase/isomerase family protein [Acidobacteria bacterium]|nr:enoyl-CoA hydratase/isomerase family protein [Acidobacteriota bacterium]